MRTPRIGVYRHMVVRRYRIFLPVTQGALGTALIIWNVHNTRVIESMGMAWDMGAPIWPYQASWLLLVGINAPAYVPSDTDIRALSSLHWPTTLCGGDGRDFVLVVACWPAH